MNFKQFLKPDLRKIVIFAVIGFLVFIDVWRYETSVLFIKGRKTIGIRRVFSCYIVPRPFKAPQVTICTFSLNPLIWVFSNVKINVEGVICGKNLYWYCQAGAIYTRLLIATYFIPPFYWYLLSCLIIWIWDKLKKKF